MLKPEEYVWSSDRAYRRGRGHEWLDVDRLLERDETVEELTATLHAEHAI